MTPAVERDNYLAAEAATRAQARVRWESEAHDRVHQLEGALTYAAEMLREAATVLAVQKSPHTAALAS